MKIMKTKTKKREKQTTRNCLDCSDAGLTAAVRHRRGVHVPCLTRKTVSPTTTKDSQKAYFASRAGLENVRVLLAQGGKPIHPGIGVDCTHIWRQHGA